MRRRGFSLLELSMVLVVSGLMLGFLTQMGATVDATKCYTSTKTQIIAINEAIQRFARKNDRLPMPAARNIGVEDINYGREALAAAIDQAGGVSFGALPFQALGLSPSMAGDCWGNKFTYMVTTALTTNASSGGYLDSTVEGNISRKNNGGGSADTKIAYVIVSHGMDELGAVELNYTGVSKGWCGGASNLKTMNCLATIAEFADAVFNDGKDALAGAFKGPSNNYYFDDLVIAGGKPKILSSIAGYFAFGWGGNFNSPIGNAFYDKILTPNLIYSPVNFVSIASGAYHACGLTTAGAAYCWGTGTSGQLGDGTTTRSATRPAAVSGGITFSDIEAGAYHSCGRTATDEVYCWGYNISGQLGDGTNTQRTTPTPLSGALALRSISVGASHTCGITPAGAAYCWGLNANGQLGDGTTTPKTVPTLVLGGLVFSAISAGPAHTCGITVAGAAYCWGGNASGQIGDTSTTQRTTPTAVSGGLTFSKIFTGGIKVTARVSGHSCGITTSNETYCWGGNGDGQLGDGTTANKNIPTKVSGGLIFTKLILNKDPTGFIASATDPGSTCGLANTGAIYCWGGNGNGQLGNGTTVSSSVPTPTTGGYLFNQLSMSYTSTCGISTVGPTYCWGGYETLANGKTDMHFTTTAVAGGLLFKQVSRGNVFSCGLTPTGTAYCWGMNNQGQVGDGTITTPRPSPTLVSGGLTFTTISSGTLHSCGLTSAGAAYCWGANSQGQIGDGTNTTPRTSPTAVIGGHTFQSIVAGNTTTCGLTTAGAAYCWGMNNVGQVGDGTTTTPRLSPTAVAGGLTFSSLSKSSAGTYFCGLTAAGAAYCWGANNQGQIGDGTTTTPRTSPTAVIGGHAFTSISSGSTHSCGLTTAGAAYCWGMNSQGQVGDGTTTTPRTSPTAVTGGYVFTAVDTGPLNGCGITTTGATYCWGWNQDGQTGNGTISLGEPIPNLIPGTGSAPLKAVRVSMGATQRAGGGAGIILVEPSGYCTLPNGKPVPSGWFDVFYQSATPVGSCAPEYRACAAGTLSGSYTQETCIPGCPTQLVTWPGSPGTTCSATVTATASPAVTAISSTAPGTTGSATATCNTDGTLTLSATSCTP